MNVSHLSSGLFSRLATLVLLAFCSNALSSHAAEATTISPKTCESHPTEKGKSRQRFDSLALMVVAGELEAQGEAAFHLKYDAPSADCALETFTVGDTVATVHYNPWEKGPSTLHYRIELANPKGNTEVLVLYSGTSALVAHGGGYVFHVSEERDGVISWYAMFRDEPAYSAVKALVEQIANGSTKPLMAVRWPTGAKEAQVVAFDNKRLK
ncbi:MAG: hypothetical protein ACJ8R9_16155 [Steroidobacteraceae bacterium]